MRIRAAGCATRSSGTSPSTSRTPPRNTAFTFRGDTGRVVLLMGFAFLAGAGTALSPCVLPVLPIALSAGATGGSRRPLGVVTGLALSFTFATVALVYLIHALGLPNDLLRTIAVVGVLMLANVDTRFQNAVASDLPSFLVNPTGGLESSHAVRSELAAVRGHRNGVGSASPHAAGTASSLPVYGPAPALSGTQKWFNTPGGRALSLSPLRSQHRVVLIDFWTYTCINCIRTLPQLEAWDGKYRGDGLTIIGVHTPEFPFEHDASNVRSAVAQDGIRYPVVQDNDQAVWNAYANQYWPAEYLIDAHGNVRYVHFGEGEYPHTESAIRSLLAE